METTFDTAAELAAMERMSAGRLRERYRELFGEEPRSWHRQCLFRRCAWRLQTLAEGDLSERARQRAQELARDVDLRVRPPAGMDVLPPTHTRPVVRPAKAQVPRKRDARLPMPGTKLRRPYKGHVYEVEVLDKAPFASRGDNSGTHMKEKALWQAAAYCWLRSSRVSALKSKSPAAPSPCMAMTILPATSRRVMFAQPFAPSTVIRVVFIWFSFAFCVRPSMVIRACFRPGSKAKYGGHRINSAATCCARGASYACAARSWEIPGGC
jgi:hypothetical protein